MTDYISSLRKAAVRSLRALLGIWLMLGPFVLFLIRWKVYEMVIIFLVVVAAFVFVGLNSRKHGTPYLTQLATDTAIALGIALLAGGLSGILAKLTRVYLHGHVLFVPLVILAGFCILEYSREKRRRAQRSSQIATGDVRNKDISDPPEVGRWT